MSDEFDPSEDTPATKQIHEWIGQELGRKEVTTANRASSAPQCVRKRWFQNQGVQGEPLQPRSILVFATGDLVEHAMKYFIANGCVGPGKLYSEVDFGTKDGSFIVQHREFVVYKQEKLEINFPSLIVSGSPDGWGKRNSDGEWELIEIKSASSYGFRDFVSGKMGYKNQIHALMMSEKAKSLGVKSARMFYMNKDTSHISDRLYQFEPAVAAQVEREFLLANKAEQPDVPVNDPDIGPQEEIVRKQSTGKLKLGWKCSYCDYNKKCWPQARIDFKFGKPIYYLEKG